MKMGARERREAAQEIEDGKRKAIVYEGGQQVGDTYCSAFDKDAADMMIEDCSQDFARFRWMAEYKRDVGEALYVARNEAPAAWTVGAIPEPTGLATGADRGTIFSGRDSAKFADPDDAADLKDQLVAKVPNLSDAKFIKLCQDVKGKMNQALGDAEFQRKLIKFAHQRWYEASLPRMFASEEKRRFPSKPYLSEDSKKQGQMWVAALIQFSGSVPTEYPAMGSFHMNRVTVRRRGGNRAR